MPKKGESQGSVYYDKNKNRWIAQYYEFDFQKNKSVRRTKFLKTEEEAKRKLESIMYQKSNPIYIQNNGIPLIELMKANAQKKLDTNLISENQFARINNTIDVISKSYIATTKIDDLTSDEIQGYLNSIKHYSNSYIKKIFEQFSQSFKYAMNKGYIYRNPMNDVIKPKSLKKDKIVRALTVEEQQDFTDYLTSLDVDSQPYRNVFLIQMYMGLRVGEALALRNYDIDLKHDLIRVEKTLTTNKDGKVVMGDSAKTYAGNRDLPIPQYLKPFILEQMKIGENNMDKQLFLSTNGKYIDSRNVNRMLKKILKENFNITDITTHSLRHTYGTRCIEAGMSPVALQRLMGHNDVSVTLNTYTSVFNRYKQSELDKVNNYYLNNSLLPGQNNKLDALER